jgi:hypothetical protein
MPAVGVEDATVTWAKETCLVGLPVDGAAKMRADRGQDSDVLFAAPPDPESVPDARLAPAVFVEHFHRHKTPLFLGDIRQGASVEKSSFRCLLPGSQQWSQNVSQDRDHHQHSDEGDKKSCAIVQEPSALGVGVRHGWLSLSFRLGIVPRFRAW